jgi:8-oxo-dGTP pyrophosphatase MutT (NUDIX family)
VRADQSLLVVRDRASGRLGFPAGASAGGEAAPCTASRETLEETGISVRVEERLRVFDNGFHLYRCSLLDEKDYVPGAIPVPEFAAAEISDIAWLPPSSITAAEWRYPEEWNEVLALFAAGAAASPLPDSADTVPAIESAPGDAPVPAAPEIDAGAAGLRPAASSAADKVVQPAVEPVSRQAVELFPQLNVPKSR